MRGLPMPGGRRDRRDANGRALVDDHGLAERHRDALDAHVEVRAGGLIQADDAEPLQLQTIADRDAARCPGRRRRRRGRRAGRRTGAAAAAAAAGGSELDNKIGEEDIGHLGLFQNGCHVLGDGGFQRGLAFGVTSESAVCCASNSRMLERIRVRRTLVLLRLLCLLRRIDHQPHAEAQEPRAAGIGQVDGERFERQRPGSLRLCDDSGLRRPTVPPAHASRRMRRPRRRRGRRGRPER